MEKPIKVVTALEMKEIDKVTTQKYGLRSLILMENAGTNCARQIQKIIKNYLHPIKKIKIFCGPGNNGGDGLVIARHLLLKDHDPEVFLMTSITNLSGDALENAQIYQNHQGILHEIDHEEKVATIHLSKNDLIIDAILGIGLTRPLEGLIQQIVKKINKSGAMIVSIDIPTGLPTDVPELKGECIRADATLAIGLPKISEVLYNTRKYVGKLKVIDIGFPRDLIFSEQLKVNLLTKNSVRDFIPKRDRDGHKGSMGNLSIIAGSKGMSGAAILAARSSFLTGVGYVKLGLPESLYSIAEKNLIEVVIHPLIETSSKTIATKAYEQVVSMAKDSNALLIGPGISRNKETKQLVKKIINEIEMPVVIDADGLNILAEDVSLLKNQRQGVILTPHLKEMSRLVQKDVGEVMRDPITVATSFAQKWNLTLVLKSATTLIADPEGNVWINVIGNDGMAKAGSGDVLAGLISGLLAQKMRPTQAALLGTWFHSLAGDLTFLKLGAESMMAQDIIKNIPRAINATTH